MIPNDILPHEMTDDQIEQAHNQADMELEDFESISRGECLAELPETYEKFLQSISMSSKDDYDEVPDRIETYAIAFGALGKCYICSNPIIDESAFEEGVSDHYGIDDLTEMMSILISNPVDTANWPYCNHCAHVMSKDD